MSVGWLEYGDSGGVVLRHSLKHPLATLESGEVIPYGTITYQGAGVIPLFDPTKGMQAKGANGSGSSIKLTTPDGTMVDLLNEQGQMSFEVSTEWAGGHSGAGVNGSNGYQPSATEYLLYALTGGTSTFFVVSQNTGGMMFAQHGPAAATRSSYKNCALDGRVSATYPNGTAVNFDAHRLSTAAKGQYVKVNIGWYPGRYEGWLIIAIDGLIYNGINRYFDPASTGTFLSELHIGGSFGASTLGANSSTPLYIRNLQISTESPRFDFHPLLRKIYVLSDSIFETGDQTDPMADNECELSFRKKINQNSLHLGDMEVDQNGGYTVSTLDTQLITKIAPLLSANPSIVVINGGTNDIQYVTWPSDFEAEYLDLLEQIFFTAAKTGRSSVEYVVCNGVPPRDNENFSVDLLEVKQAECETAIKDVITLWDATYPEYSGRVVYHDVLGGFGGNNPGVGYSLDGVHLDYLGTEGLGRRTAGAVLSVLS